MASNTSSAIKWRPLDVLEQHPVPDTAYIQLNVPLEPLQIFKLLWENAAFRLFTDGAVNRLYNNGRLDKEKYIPHVVSGDFDSAETKILEYYKGKGTEVIHTPVQDETDFTKGLRILTEKIKSTDHNITSIVAHDDVSGRLDHLLSNINTLYTAEHITDMPLYSVTSTCVSCLLKPGAHEISVNSPKRGDWCSLVPMGAKCNHVTTTGLKWNLNGDAMEFGGIISTSNTFTDSDTVHVHTDGYLLWSMGIAI